MTAWSRIRESARMPEAQAVATLRSRARLDPARRASISAEALRLATLVRANSAGSLRAESFLQRYRLSTHEGIVLMCLAEALLRIPDDATVDALIRDKLAGTHWDVKEEGPLLMNAASWGLMLTGKLAEWRAHPGGTQPLVRGLIARAGEPLVRTALRHAMQIMAEQFVAGESIESALGRERPGWRYSYDMLGEAARTAHDAEIYFSTYLRAIRALAQTGTPGPIEARPGISIKLSALHPRYEVQQRDRLFRELLPRLVELCEAAASAGIPLTLDAEESERLVPSLELFEQLARAPSLSAWQGLGLAVQAYQKRALPVCEWIVELAGAAGRRILVRLVKGAYWDTEIKLAQVQGVSDYPVFTRKAATDVSFMACAQLLLAAGRRVFAQFATHNCYSAAFVLECAGERRDFEFQKLHGMGQALHQHLIERYGTACRIYAPVGSHRDLLAYLVRRLLENGANTSFVHQVADESIPIERLAADPMLVLPDPYTSAAHIPPPRELYPDRLNSEGLDLSEPHVLERLAQRVREDRESSQRIAGAGTPISEPADRGLSVGRVQACSIEDVDRLAREARAAWPVWAATPARERARLLECAAEKLEQCQEELISLLVREAGRTYADSANEVREAADYCRYYAARARAEFAGPVALPGPTGESNRLELVGRGVFACISPWNFPLAIFTGQVTAALAAGNAVIAKPAEQTPLVGSRAVAILHEAGIPAPVLRLAIGDGERIGSALVRHASIAGIAFTGSFDTAKAIERALAARAGPIIPLIAETGGLNAMVVDSSALPEQVVADALTSAFDSAGQRCSALRVLLLQEEAAPRIIEMLAGAMAELRVGDPGRPDTDVGPVIDEPSRQALQRHAKALQETARLIARCPLAAECEHGTFFAPVAFEISLEQLPQREVFGPILHVLRFRSSDLERALEAIAATGYGLTLGVHSRLDGFVERVRGHLPAGNAYVNRNMIGAVVGVQPFGGEGLSGTGPKAGSPRTLYRFALERTLTINTAAMGGNPELFG